MHMLPIDCADAIWEVPELMETFSDLLPISGCRYWHVLRDQTVSDGCDHTMHNTNHCREAYAVTEAQASEGVSRGKISAIHCYGEARFGPKSSRQSSQKHKMYSLRKRSDKEQARRHRLNTLGNERHSWRHRWKHSGLFHHQQ